MLTLKQIIRKHVVKKSADIKKTLETLTLENADINTTLKH